MIQFLIFKFLKKSFELKMYKKFPLVQFKMLSKYHLPTSKIKFYVNCDIWLTLQIKTSVFYCILTGKTAQVNWTNEPMNIALYNCTVFMNSQKLKYS